MFENITPTYISELGSRLLPKITAMAALAHIYQIELASTLVLCAHLCALAFWCRRSSPSPSTSSSSNKKPQTPDCDQVWCFGIQGVRTRDRVEESETRDDGNDGRCRNVCCEWVPGEEGDWVPGEKTGERELRRSERARIPTRRFEESWFKGNLPALRDALSSDEE